MKASWRQSGMGCGVVVCALLSLSAGAAPQAPPPRPSSPPTQPRASAVHPISPSGAMPRGVQGSVTTVHPAPAIPIPAVSEQPLVAAAPPTPVEVETPRPERGAYEQLNKVMMHRPVRFYLKLMADSGFSKAWEEIAKQGDWLKLLYIELGLIVAVAVLRSWRMSKTTFWHRHLWTKTWTRLLFWVLALTAVPYAVFGAPYLRSLQGVWDVVIDMIK